LGWMNGGRSLIGAFYNPPDILCYLKRPQIKFRTIWRIIPAVASKKLLVFDSLTLVKNFFCKKLFFQFCRRIEARGSRNSSGSLGRTGGVAHVAGALPEALNRLGTDVRVVFFPYRSLGEGQFEPNPLFRDLEVSLGIRSSSPACRKPEGGRGHRLFDRTEGEG